MEGREPQIQLTVRTLQIIVAAMVMGVIVFTGVAILIGPTLTEDESGPTLRLLRIVCGVSIAVGAIVPFFMRSAILRSNAGAADADPEKRAASAFLTATIIAAAMNEGPALFGAVIVLLGGPGPSLLLVAVPLALLILQFPTEGQYTAFVSRMRDNQSV